MGQLMKYVPLERMYNELQYVLVLTTINTSTQNIILQISIRDDYLVSYVTLHKELRVSNVEVKWNGNRVK